MDERDEPRDPDGHTLDADTHRLKREELLRALDAVAGIFRGTPHAQNREQVSAWIHELRSEETD